MSHIFFDVSKGTLIYTNFIFHMLESLSFWEKDTAASGIEFLTPDIANTKSSKSQIWIPSIEEKNFIQGESEIIRIYLWIITINSD